MAPHNWEEYFDPRKINRSEFSSPAAKWRLGEAGDLTVLDYLITNGDRRLFRNNAVWGELKCEGRDCGGASRNVNQPFSTNGTTRPQMVFIDQGSSFYRRSGPSGNPLTPLSLGSDGKLELEHILFCRFRRRTYEMLFALSKEEAQNRQKNSLELELLGTKKDHGTLPSGVVKCIRPMLIKAAQTRLEALVKHIKNTCLKEFHEDDVFPFEEK